MYPTRLKTIAIRFSVLISFLFSVQQIIAQVPVINSFTPTSGAVNTAVTINGSNFSAVPANNTVYFGAVKAPITAATTTSLSVTVPAGALYQPVSVTVNNLTAYSSNWFSVTGVSTVLSATSFNPSVSFSTAPGPGNIAASDIDGDGKADLLSTSESNNSVLSIFRNTGTSGNIAFAARTDFTNSTWSYGLKLAVADFDGDGKTDIVIANPNGNKIFVLKNISTPGLISLATPIEITTSSPRGIAVADFNTDGKPDIAIMSGSSFQVYKNISSGANVAFTSAYSLNEGDSYTGIVTADFNTDGKPDIALLDYPNRLSIYSNMGIAGNIGFNFRMSFVTSANPTTLAAGDVDEDGVMDVAVLNQNANTVSLFKNTSSTGGTIFMAPKIDIATNNIPYCLAFGNVDGDSKPDLLVGTGQSRISVYQNNSSGGSLSFATKLDYTTNGNSGSLIACDLDNDGKTDISATQGNASNIAIIRNRQNEPVISGFTPKGGQPGTSVLITGSNFTGASSVAIGTVPATSFVIQSDNTITAVAGNGTTGNVAVTNTYGTGSLAEFVFGPLPVITSFSPASAKPGETIQIKGVGFTGTTAISFGGIPAQFFFAVTDTSIRAVVGAGASGNVSVTATTGTGVLSGFTFLPPPAITSFTPTSSFSGTAIDIKGSNFTGAAFVNFGEVPAASFTVHSDTSLTAVVGAGATGSVAVFNQNGTGSLAGFTYLGPNISSFTPAAGGPGTIITISGTNFTGATAVSFGGVPAASFTVVSPTTITAVAGNGATGDVTVTTSTGTGTRSGFSAPPFIAGISPAAAPAGATVTITGNSFFPFPSANSVYFGTVKAQVTAADFNALTVTVPAGAIPGPVSVSSRYLTGYFSRAFVTTFTGGPLVPASFALKQLVANSTGSTIAIGDVNSDSKPDIVMPKPGGIAVLKNSSTVAGIAFDTVLNFPAGNNGGTAGAITVADLNMDGHLDVITAGMMQNSVTVFPKNNFTAQLDFLNGINLTVGSGPYAIAVGDLDKDGKPDIVVSNNGSQTFSVLKNIGMNGPTAFAAKIDFPTAASPGMVSLADFDQDGKLDIVILNTSSTSFSVFRNTSSGNGTITFAAKNDVATAASPLNMAIADIDGDDRIDLMVNNSGSFSVFRNSSAPGTISLAPKVDFTTPVGYSGVTINDLDGDGKPDVVVNHAGNALTYIFKNTSTTGAASFNPPVPYPVLEYSGFSYTGDMDGDGKTDIISASSSGIYFIRNKFNEAPVITSISPQTVRIGDTVLITGTRFTGATAVNFGTTAFNSFTVLSDTRIAAIVGTGSGGAVSVITPYGTSSFGNLSVLLPPVIVGFSPANAAVGNAVTITGSGFSPVATNNTVFFGTTKAMVTAATASSLTVVVPAGVSHQHISVTVNGLSAWSPLFFNTLFPGAGPAFASYYFDTANNVTLPGVSGIRAISTGDIDMDGKPDLAMAIYDGSSLRASIVKNTGNGTNISFGSRIVQPQGGGNSIRITDMDGDGKPDVAISTRNNLIPLGIYKNNSTPGNLSLITDFFLNVPVAEARIQTADIDQDGRPDIVIKSNYDSKVLVCRNSSANGVSVYSLPITAGEVSALSAQENSGELLVEDFSGDSKPDIVILFDNKISVFKNNGTVGNISFSPETNFYFRVGAAGISIASDFDGDGKIDIAELNKQSGALSILKNTSANGNIVFTTPTNMPLGFVPYRLAVGDLDGDGKPDLCVGSNGANTIFSGFKNTSAAGTITFAPAINFTGNIPGPITIDDINSDGKPDIISANEANNRIQIFRNAIGEPIPLLLCPPVASTFVSSNITGATYQWQVNTGNSFIAIADNANYTGTTTATLQLNNIPSSWYGYQYRCIAGAVSSNVFAIQFANRWSGAVSTAWGNPANWSCGTMPDANSDVVINAGTVIINSSVTIRSLKVNPGATVRVAGGHVLTVLQ